MAKRMKTDIDKNLDNKGNSKGFNKGSEPVTHGPGDTDFYDVHDEYDNEVGGQSNPNGDKNKVYDKRMRTPREPVLNAVPMPNTNKGKRVNRSVLSYTGDGEAKYPAPADNIIGGTPRPNTIK